jgi:hypothetical protein
MILIRLSSYLRRHCPHTHLLVRGDNHYVTSEIIAVITSYRWTDFGLGLAGNAVLLRQAASTIQAAQGLHRERVALAQAYGQVPQTSSRIYDEFVYAAGPGHNHSGSCSRPRS